VEEDEKDKLKPDDVEVSFYLVCILL